MPPRELTLRDLDKILRIPNNTPSTQESIETWVKDMVKFLLSMSWKDQKPN